MLLHRAILRQTAGPGRPNAAYSARGPDGAGGPAGAGSRRGGAESAFHASRLPLIMATSAGACRPRRRAAEDELDERDAPELRELPAEFRSSAATGASKCGKPVQAASEIISAGRGTSRCPGHIFAQFTCAMPYESCQVFHMLYLTGISNSSQFTCIMPRSPFHSFHIFHKFYIARR